MQSEHIFRLKDPAFVALYERYAPEIFAYLRLHTPTREDAEDLLVDVFLAALEQGSLQEVPAEKQRAWLWRVARYKTIDLYRIGKRHAVARLEELTHALYFDEELEPEQYAVRAERYGQIARYIRRLPVPQQQVIYLHFVHGLRSKSMAQLLQKREGTIRTLLSRALNTLRTMIGKEEYSDRF